MLRKSISYLLSLALVGAATIAALEAAAPPARASVAPQLTRYPYLTDVVLDAATVNWATDRSATSGSLTYGRVGSEPCTAHKVTASKTAITDKSTAEFQWKAKLSGLQPNTRYCYRILLGATERGLGGCVIASIDQAGLRSALQVPEHLEILLVVALGKPSETVLLESGSPDERPYWRDGRDVHHVPKRRLADLRIELPGF